MPPEHREGGNLGQAPGGGRGRQGELASVPLPSGPLGANSVYFRIFTKFFPEELTLLIMKLLENVWKSKVGYFPLQGSLLIKKISFLSKLELASHHSSNKNNLFNNLNFLHLLSFDCIYLQITRFGDSNYLFPLCHITWQLGSTTFMASFKWALTNASLF